MIWGTRHSEKAAPPREDRYVTPNEKKMGWAIVAGVAITFGVAAWNFYVAFLFLPTVFVVGLFAIFGVTFAKNLCRGSRRDSTS